jgi:ATP-binding cassette subfamily F protein uup
VSHDREFLNNVVTSVLAIDGDGNVAEYGGGYDDYARQKSSQASKASQQSPSAPTKSSSAKSSTANQPPTTAAPAPAKAAKPKLSFKEQKELESIPTKIESTEAQREQLHAAMAEPGFYQQDSTTIATAVAKLEKLDQQLAQLFARWEELENRTA